MSVKLLHKHRIKSCCKQELVSMPTLFAIIKLKYCLFKVSRAGTFFYDQVKLNKVPNTEGFTDFDKTREKKKLLKSKSNKRT